MNPQENNSRPSPNYFERIKSFVLGNSEEKEAVQKIVDAAEASGDFAQATLITEEVLHEHGERQIELRKKWSEKELANGHFLRAAEILNPVASSAEEMRPIAEKAGEAGEWKDAHEIYCSLIRDHVKCKEALEMMAEQKTNEGDYFAAARMMDGAEKPEKISGILRKAEEAKKYDDAVGIYEEVLNDYNDEWYRFRKLWSNSLLETGNYIDAALVMIKTKDRAAVKGIAKQAQETGNEEDAVQILHEVLHDYTPESMALSLKIMSEKPPRRYW